jgi:hypothetical protein
MKMKNILRLFYLIFMVLLPFQAFCITDSKSSKNNIQNPRNITKQDTIMPRIEQSISTNSARNATETKFLLPLYQNKNSDQLFYLDLRAKIDNSTSHQTDLTLGYRKLFSEIGLLNQSRWIIGTYASIGRSYNNYKNEFKQKSFGIELLSEIYEFRTNIYIAENKEKKIGDDYKGKCNIPEDQWCYQNTSLRRQKALDGIDFELGYKLPISAIDAKIYAGGYYYQKPKKSQIILKELDSILSSQDYNSINGQKLRLELNFNHNNTKMIKNKNIKLILASQYKHDNLNKGQIFVITKLSYQFGSNSTQVPVDNNRDRNSLTDQYNPINEFAIKNDIVTDDKRESFRIKCGNA